MIASSLHMTNAEKNAVYPGAYRPPVHNWEALVAELERNEERIHPPTIQRETGDFVRIDIPAPGHSREDFMAVVNNSKLVVVAMPHYMQAASGVTGDEVDAYSFFHTVELPGDIDPDFARAEYEAGVLRFYFPRDTHPTECLVHQVVIY